MYRKGTQPHAETAITTMQIDDNYDVEMFSV